MNVGQIAEINADVQCRHQAELGSGSVRLSTETGSSPVHGANATVIAQLSQFAGLEDGTRARTLIVELNRIYDETGRAFQIKKLADGYLMLTRPQFAKWLRQLEHVPGLRRLSKPALETLTVVAYRQPVIKADIEAIRGVACGEMLRQLLEKGLVRIQGRSEELGRPFQYGTTRDFLIEFGLRTLEDLPRFQELSGQGLLNWDNSDQISCQSNPDTP